MIPIPPFVMPHTPATNITPFTYRDGLTYLQRLERIVKYINLKIIPWVNDSYEELAETTQDQINILIAQVNEAIEQIIDNSIEANDSVVEALVINVESATNAAITALTETITNELHPTYRLWNGTSYPDRIDGALNIFFGPEDPGLLMEESDYWADPNVTTLAEVIAQTNTVNSPLYNAVAGATTDKIFISAGELTQPTGQSIAINYSGTSPTLLFSWLMPATGVSRLFETFMVPNGWNTANISVFYMHDTVESGTGIQFTITLATALVNAAFGNGQGRNIILSTTASGSVLKKTSTMNVPINDNELATVQIARVTTSPDDTYTGDIRLFGILLEKAS